jgi:hypothetical protein
MPTTTLDFMGRKMYLPGWMSVSSASYDRNSLIFGFTPMEPQITTLSERYMTPRGAHISISQAAYVLLEELAVRGQLPLDLEQIRQVYLGGRLKLTDINFRMRREVGVGSPSIGRLELSRLRLGGTPFLKMHYDLAERAITGELIGMLAPDSRPQLNQGILRINN